MDLLRTYVSVPNFLSQAYNLKVQDSEEKKTCLAEKVLKTLRSNEFVEFFISRKLLDLWTQMSSRRPFKGDARFNSE